MAAPVPGVREISLASGNERVIVRPHEQLLRGNGVISAGVGFPRPVGTPRQGRARGLAPRTVRLPVGISPAVSGAGPLDEAAGAVAVMVLLTIRAGRRVGALSRAADCQGQRQRDDRS